jgi:hypothetical protein
MKEQFCKCNNCDEVFFDTNPSNQPSFDIPKGETFRSLDNHECPTCETDGYLVDVENEEEVCNYSN